MTGTRVTATNLATGESQTVELRDDYVVVCDGDRYVDGMQIYGNGTVVVTLKLGRAAGVEGTDTE